MRKSRLTEAQIIGMIKEQEAGMPTAEVCRRHGLSPATFYKLKAKYGGMEVSEAARLKALEDENAKLKRLLADTMLDNVVLKDLSGKELTTLTRRREAALKAMRDHDISQRRTCQLIGVDPKTVRRTRPPDCPEIREEMKEIAGKRRRYGYRRTGILLERKGMLINHKKLYRLYREEGLSEKRRRGRKRARGSRTPMPGGSKSQYPLVARLPGRQLRCLAQVPQSGGDRRLLPGEPVPDCRHQHLGRPCRPRAGCAGADLRKARLHRQRQRLMWGRSGCLGQQVMGHPANRMPCNRCPDELCRQEMISSIANTGYALWRPSPSSIRDSKSQAEGPNIIYEVS